MGCGLTDILLYVLTVCLPSLCSLLTLLFEMQARQRLGYGRHNFRYWVQSGALLYSVFSTMSFLTGYTLVITGDNVLRGWLNQLSGCVSGSLSGSLHDSLNSLLRVGTVSYGWLTVVAAQVLYLMHKRRYAYDKEVRLIELLLIWALPTIIHITWFGERLGSVTSQILALYRFCR